MRMSPRVGNVHYASRRSLVSLRIRRTSRVIWTLLSGLNVNLSARFPCSSHEEFGARDAAKRTHGTGRFADCAGQTRCFLHTGRYFRMSTGGTGWSTTRFERDIAMPAA